MVSMTQLAHEIVRSVLRPGEQAIDATAGNGHDTLFLAQQVGADGRVWAFDIQPQALGSTHQRLSHHNCHHVRLIHGNHAELEMLIPATAIGHIGAVMFNLGYLPHHDHGLTTKMETTLVALCSAFNVLRPGGALTVMTYRGHPGGEEEAIAVETWMAQQTGAALGPFCFPPTRPLRGPQLLAMKKC